MPDSARLSVANRPRGQSPSAAPFITIERAALVVGLLLTLGLVALHLQYHRHAGALWRDEVTSVNVASMPTPAEVFASVPYDSFPMAWTTLLYAWRRVGLGTDDQGFRRLGLLIGVAMIGVVWWTGSRLGVGPPLVTLLLFGMSPSVVIYGDTVRGYGLAALASVWCVGAAWAFVQRPTRGRYLVAQLAAIFAAQTHFANCIVILAICLGAAAVAWRRRNTRLLAAALALGGGAAVALFAVNLWVLRYMAQAGQQERGTLKSVGWLLQVFARALAPGVPALGIAWGLAAVVAFVGLLVAWRWRRAAADAERAVYATLAVMISLALTIYAYRLTRIPTNYWHYLSLIAVSALACELGVFVLAKRFRHGEWARVAAVAAAALIASRGVAATVPLRMTSLDLAAREIAKAATPNDLVVVFPWYCGITFDRYYRGPAPWITLPDVADHRYHVHLAIREKMELGEAAVAPELARIERTLRAGGKVWVVGTPVAPDHGTALLALPSPSESGSAGRYLEHWELQLGALLEGHVREGWRVPLPDLGPVNAWENPPLFVVEGWR